MDNTLFTGKLVRLSMVDPEEFGRFYSKGARDSEYIRLSDAEIGHLNSAKSVQKWFEKYSEKDLPDHAMFMIRSLADDRLIGDINLAGFAWSHADCFVGIGIPDREYWGKGYGTDAMKLVLRYAFEELNLHRVTLDLFEYNPRAMRSYEKAGFRYEGVMRDYLNRDGKRWDMIFMGIIREEWQALTNSP